MLATGAKTPTENDPNMLWEIKYDGLRIISFGSGKNQRLQARSGTDKTVTLPEIQVETRLPAIVDGEVIGAHGERFQDSVQHRMNRVYNIEKARLQWPLKYVIFDVLEVKGMNIEDYPLRTRKEILSDLFIQTETTELASYTSDALALWQNVIDDGLEGMVGKQKQGKYRRNARDWLKVKTWKRNYGKGSTGETFLVVGYTKGTGWRASTFGAMILARLEDDGSSTYIGAVGTGTELDRQDIQALMSMFTTVSSCPWSKEPEQATWVKPFAVYIQYLEYSNDGMMRFPSFKGVV